MKSVPTDKKEKKLIEFAAVALLMTRVKIQTFTRNDLPRVVVSKAESSTPLESSTASQENNNNNNNSTTEEVAVAIATTATGQREREKFRKSSDQFTSGIGN